MCDCVRRADGAELTEERRTSGDLSRSEFLSRSASSREWLQSCVCMLSRIKVRFIVD